MTADERRPPLSSESPGDSTKMVRKPKATGAAVEDYLKTIYQHTEWQPNLIGPAALADCLGVVPSSVTEMISKLTTAGLVMHKPYGPVSLTAEGTLRALTIIRRHRIIETWLVDDMGYSWDEVHDEAEILEHAMTDRLIDSLDQRLGRPQQDPHGDPIPNLQKKVERTPFVCLSDAALGDMGEILRISDRNPELLRLLASHSIGPGTVLRVHDVNPSAVRVTIDPTAHRMPRIDIPRIAADSIWMTPQSRT